MNAENLSGEGLPAEVVETIEQLKAKLTLKQLRFCEGYIEHGNATKAAVDARHPERSAYSIGWENLRKPEIRKYIDRRLEESSLGKPETLKSISDIARGSLNGYLKARKIVKTPKITIPLAEYIGRTKTEVENLEYVHQIATNEGLLGTGKEYKKHVTTHQQEVRALKRLIITLEVELANNPEATRIVDGEPELVEVMDLDLPKLARDKDAPRIKSITMTEFGPKIEMCAPDAALINLARIHGLYEKDNHQKVPEIPTMIPVYVVPPKEVDE